MAELATTTPYPIALGAGLPETSTRPWAFPLLGIVVKVIILIPHWFILYVLYLVALLLQLVIWAPVLFTGRYPDWAYILNAGLLRWYIRLSWFAYGLSDKYPEFAMEAAGDMLIEQPATSNRLWAFPLLGFLVKCIILIPHFVVLYVLAIVVGVCQLVIWIPVLFTGHYPSWAFTLNAGFLLWSTRLSGDFLGLTDRYPPFAMR